MGEFGFDLRDCRQCAAELLRKFLQKPELRYAERLGYIAEGIFGDERWYKFC